MKENEEMLGHPSMICPKCKSELNLYLTHETIEFPSGIKLISTHEIRCQGCTFRMIEIEP